MTGKPLSDDELVFVVEMDVETDDQQLRDDLLGTLPVDEDGHPSQGAGAVQAGKLNIAESRHACVDSDGKCRIKSRLAYDERRGAQSLFKKLGRMKRLRNRARPRSSIEVHDCPGGATSTEWDCSEHVTDVWDRGARQ